ncbi:MAG TPA: ATP-binding protein [Edaphobacter sp.]|nr:ATP-binding protein [Edaphobacter sp.]
MASDEHLPDAPAQITRLPLGVSKRRLSFERSLRIGLYLLGLPGFILCWLLLWQHSAEASATTLFLLVFALAWTFVVSLLMEHITRPLQTLANVVAALREDDYSFRARGGRRNDAVGDLALEINALAALLQSQRAGSLEAMALVERVMSSMPSPVLAFDPDGRLRLLNTAAEHAFTLRAPSALGRSAEHLNLQHLLDANDNDLLSLDGGQQVARWVVKRTSFRMRGVPHVLLVLSDVSAALHEEERIAWERLIRVLGHEINNSLTPIKSIAGSLRGRLASSAADNDFHDGLEVIEERAESLNRFLQGYQRLMRLPAPKLAPVSVATLVERVARLETRVSVLVTSAPDVTVLADPDQVQQALINLMRNAAEASLSIDTPDIQSRHVEITWETSGHEVVIAILDDGPGLINAGNLFVPFYTTKPGGTGIGLALTQQIALAHKGSARLANRTDGHSGCRAELHLPLSA